MKRKKNVLEWYMCDEWYMNDVCVYNYLHTHTHTYIYRATGNLKGYDNDNKSHTKKKQCLLDNSERHPLKVVDQSMD